MFYLFLVLFRVYRGDDDGDDETGVLQFNVYRIMGMFDNEVERNDYHSVRRDFYNECQRRTFKLKIVIILLQLNDFALFIIIIILKDRRQHYNVLISLVGSDYMAKQKVNAITIFILSLKQTRKLLKKQHVSSHLKLFETTTNNFHV